MLFYSIKLLHVHITCLHIFFVYIYLHLLAQDARLCHGRGKDHRILWTIVNASGRLRLHGFGGLRCACRREASRSPPPPKYPSAEGKRWVGVLIEEAWRLFLLMRHRAVPYQGKPKSVVAVEGSRAQCRILARSGLAQYSAPSLKEKAAVRLQTTCNKIHQQWVVLWMDNWYNKQFTTNTDKNDKSLNATALAPLLLKDAPRYWHGHPSLEELERRVPVVARMLGNTEGTFARIPRHLRFASTRPVVRNIRAPLDIIRPVPAKRPHWRPLCLSQEKVSGNVSLLNLLQCTRDLAQHTRPVVPV